MDEYRHHGFGQSLSILERTSEVNVMRGRKLKPAANRRGRSLSLDERTVSVDKRCSGTTSVPSPTTGDIVLFYGRIAWQGF